MAGILDRFSPLTQAQAAGDVKPFLQEMATRNAFSGDVQASSRELVGALGEQLGFAELHAQLLDFAHVACYASGAKWHCDLLTELGCAQRGWKMGSPQHQQLLARAITELVRYQRRPRKRRVATR